VNRQPGDVPSRLRRIRRRQLAAHARVLRAIERPVESRRPDRDVHRVPARWPAAARVGPGVAAL